MKETDCKEYLDKPRGTFWDFREVLPTDLYISIYEGDYGSVRRAERLDHPELFGRKRWCLNILNVPLFLWDAVEYLSIDVGDVNKAVLHRQEVFSKLSTKEARKFIDRETEKYAKDYSEVL